MTTESTHPDQRYMFDQAWLAEQRRLAALETIWDPYTTQHRGPRPARGGAVPGRGAGIGSVTAWLSSA